MLLRGFSPVLKTGTTKKNVAKTAIKSADKDRKTDADKINVDGVTVYVGNMKITDGSIETKDTIIDENGIRPRVPINPIVPPDFKNLTPAQRRRMRMIRRNNPPPYPAPSLDRVKRKMHN